MNTTLSISMRPESLDSVLGHQRIVAGLKKQMAEGKVAKGYILDGPPGVGKTTLARILARDINGGETAEIHELNAADENGVDAIRALVETADYLPLTGRYKVFILDEAQQLTQQAQNVLLKPLEAEHGAAVFFFPTTDPSKLIQPLRSRCLQYSLKAFGADDLQELANRAGAQLGVDAKVLEGFGEVAARSNVTGPREALMALEKVAAGIPVREALYRPEHAPEYADLARLVLSGNWTKAQEALGKIKSADVGGLRSVLAAFFRSALLKWPMGEKANAVADALTELGQAAPHEQGVAYAVLTATLYRLCGRLG